MENILFLQKRKVENNTHGAFYQIWLDLIQEMDETFLGKNIYSGYFFKRNSSSLYVAYLK